MSYRINNCCEIQHIHADFGEYYLVKVPLRIENKWNAIKRDKVANAARQVNEVGYNKLYTVNDEKEAFALTKIVFKE